MEFFGVSEELNRLEKLWQTKTAKVRDEVGESSWITSAEGLRSRLELLGCSKIAVGLSGPGASGKTTVLNDLRKKFYFFHIINTTTRKSRLDETHGIDYRFYSQRDFFEYKKQGRFAISGYKSGRGYYGIFEEDLMEAVKFHRCCLIESPEMLNRIFGDLKCLDSKYFCILLYLLPKKPIVKNLIRFLKKRDENLAIEEIRVNHGERQLKEFESVTTANNADQILVISGIEPLTISRIIGTVGRGYENEQMCSNNHYK